MDRQKKIVTMFDNIAATYDISNRVLSFGIDKSWRKSACEKAYAYLGNRDLEKIVDVACGTGDMCAFWSHIAQDQGIAVGEIVGVDPSVGMLEVARQKEITARFVEGEAKDIPVENDSADIVSIAYGIRNVVDRMEGLSEFNRILRQGGLVVILEFTRREKAGMMTKARDFYMKHILPVIGGILSKNYEAYKYLPDSIDDFASTEELERELKESGFEIVEIKSYSMEISTLFIARKL
jgi:demethylmenaquinone methyltransferase/2-methoxy-6-polyprenyl-1,4-benzoquinol methylase